MKYARFIYKYTNKKILTCISGKIKYNKKENM